MITVCQATLSDMDGVLALLKANHVSSMTEEEKKNGFVTTNMTKDIRFYAWSIWYLPVSDVSGQEWGK